MFSSVEARFALRATLVGIGGAVSALAAGSDWKQILASGVLLALGYAGLGAAVPQVEPSIGRKLS